ncbi:MULTISPECIES: TrkH family potassium uptake protein [unclassified Thermosipho (in: thermotogales)]|uniref:TrkH family potassium uptake protein n=1 Tax=unclassified Thermosipho (in: thermotogales) TaxID=2676525 RepID=UPI00098533E8|nr:MULTISPECIES: TrkH family potassium uptake protein [unclassified Thermosipho (in: thermotogales)]MBT1247581.1 potassium transporter [Thermosipho sp. 1244]OOC46181.1 potassium transporter [Thermosipho sp. 1223]
MPKKSEQYKVIIYNVGLILMYYAIIILFPIFLVLFYPNEMINIFGFAFPAFFSFILGYTLFKISNISSPQTVTVREGAVIVLLTWLSVVLIGSIPFMIIEHLTFSQAVFESTSGFTTTGLTMFTDVTNVSKMILVWRSFMQFIGGAGFALIMMGSVIGPKGFGLYHAEGRVDNIAPNIKRSARIISLIYVSYAIVGTILLDIFGMPLFDAFNHSLTALATGGFSVRNGSIGEYNNLSLEIIIIILMFLGGTGFGVHYVLWKGDFKALSKNGEPWLMLSTVFLTSTLISINGFGKIFNSFSEGFRESIFQTASAITGTGFSTVDLTNPMWVNFGLAMFILTSLMMAGGGMDSTAGGLKQYRIWVTIKVVIHSIKEFLLPSKSVTKIFAWKGQNKNTITNDDIKEIFLVFSMYFFTFFIGSIILSTYGYDLTSSMFEFASAMNGVGLSVGITKPTMPLGAMWTLTIAMFTGRLEFLVIIYAIAKLVVDLKETIKK